MHLRMRLQSPYRTARRSFFSLRRRPLSVPAPVLLSSEFTSTPLDEEKCPGYDSKSFYPAKPGEVLANRYQLLVKVGWGTTSTVWFARDMRGWRWESESAVALKIINSDPWAGQSERQTEQQIAETDPSHPGHSLLRTHSECFEIDGPHGRHTCLAYPPLREPMWLYRRRFVNEKIPLELIKLHIYFLLMALDYLHANCKIVHTDLKLENIMVTFEDTAVLSEFLNSQLERGTQYKLDSSGRAIYPHQKVFGALRNVGNIPQIVDFGPSTRLDEEDLHGVYPIQPDHYRAPEVILGCGWQMSADIWNFGVILWDLIHGKELFRNVHDAQGNYDAKSHLAEMIALLGPPPVKLIKRHQSRTEVGWKSFITRMNGKRCANANDFFDGPFFDQDGKFLYGELIPDRTLSDTIDFSDEKENEKEKENFLSFVKLMLTWLPEERKTAKELMEHPFLGWGKDIS